MATNGDQQPTLWELAGEHISVTYSTTSISGQPNLTYFGPQGRFAYSTDEINATDTELGTEVTVTLPGFTDEDQTAFTVLLPPVRSDDHSPIAIETLGITTLKRSSIAGPPPGQDYSYTVTPLSGEATFAEF